MVMQTFEYFGYPEMPGRSVFTMNSSHPLGDSFVKHYILKLERQDENL
jgi:hypothetical protein